MDRSHAGDSRVDGNGNLPQSIGRVGWAAGYRASAAVAGSDGHPSSSNPARSITEILLNGYGEVVRGVHRVGAALHYGDPGIYPPYAKRDERTGGRGSLSLKVEEGKCRIAAWIKPGRYCPVVGVRMSRISQVDIGSSLCPSYVLQRHRYTRKIISSSPIGVLDVQWIGDAKLMDGKGIIIRRAIPVPNIPRKAQYLRAVVSNSTRTHRTLGLNRE